MGDVADAAAALAAVANLRNQITDAYQAGERTDTSTAARLAGQCAELYEHARWLRDASVATARRSGSSWDQLERATRTADATLAYRLRKFLSRESSDARRR